MSAGKTRLALVSENLLCYLIPPNVAESVELIGDDRSQCRDAAGILRLTISLDISLATYRYSHNQ